MTPTPVPSPSAAATATTSPVPRASGSRPAPSPSYPPTATNVVHGGQYWAVYLAISRTYGDPKLDAAERQARAVGYREFSGGDIGCDRGAREGLVRAGIQLDPDVNYVTRSLLFATQRDAQAFVDAYQPPVVGTVQVTTYCLD